MAIALRTAFGQILAKLGEENNRFVVFTADSSGATGAGTFVQKFPERSFDVGIAEQNLISAAAGFSTIGVTTFVSGYGLFSTSRVADQIRNSVCYPNLNVKIVSSHVGLDAGNDGASHQTIEDLAIMRAIPNIIILIPADAIELEAMLRFLLQHKGPAYMRTTRAAMGEVSEPTYTYRLGKAPVLARGTDVTLVAAGVMVPRALEARKILESRRVSAELINCSTLKPLDRETIVDSARKTGAVITAEDHNILGGIGGAVSQLLSELQPTPMEFIGVRDTFGAAGDLHGLYAKYGMSSQHIVEAAERVIRRKK